MPTNLLNLKPKQWSAVIGQRSIMLLAFITLLTFTSCNNADERPPTDVATVVTQAVASDEANSAETASATQASAIVAQPVQKDDDTPPSATPSPTNTATPTATPTQTPEPSARMRAAATAMWHGNYSAAIDEFSAIEQTLRPNELVQFAIAHYEEGDFQAAQDTLFLIEPADRDSADAYYWLGEAFAALGDCANAEGSYTSFLSSNLDLAAYIQPKIAQCQSGLGQIGAYEQAVDTPSHYIKTYQNRVQLAQLYLENGRFSDAATVYSLARNAAFTRFTQAEMGYLAAKANIQAGNTQLGYDEYRRMIRDYPEFDSTHLALIALLDAGGQVDLFQRGLVNYYADSYTPCISSFVDYFATVPQPDREAHIYLASCYEGVGNIQAAIAELDEYANLSVTSQSIGLLEKADLLRRSVSYSQAIVAYDEIVLTLPQYREAAEAAWWSAVLADWTDDDEDALVRYRFVADNYSWYENAGEALFLAGLHANKLGKDALAVELWQQSAETFPNTEFGTASLAWAWPLSATVGTTTTVPTLNTLAADLPQWATYYNRRVADLAAGIEPFTLNGTVNLNNSAVRNRAETRAFIREQAGLADDVDVDEVSAEIATDPHFLRGTRLWQLRQFDAAKREFAWVRTQNEDDIAAQYALSLYLRKIGLYSQSIIAAQRALNLTNESEFTAPKFLVSLAYPTYYDELIVPLAEEYELDPLVQFSLVRQESLFESFATSTAIAQGLAQVIPDTGQYVADRLAWPDYTNDDLYRPYVGLTFGAFYVADQLALFDGSVPAALAAYNGGPGNALKWYGEAGSEIDPFYEEVNFGETRSYIERIYSGYAVYRHLYVEP